MSNYLKYGKNITIYFTASLIPMVLNLLINPMIALNMSPTDYAIVGYYTSFSSLIQPIIVYYLVHFYIKEYFRRDEKSRIELKAVIAKALIYFSFIVSVVCFYILYAYLKLKHDSLDFPIMPYLALTVFALPLTGLLALEQAQFRMDRNANAYFRITTINGLLSILVTLCFVVLIKWGAFGKLSAILVSNGLIFGYLVFKHRKLLKTKTPFRKFKPILIFCTPLALSASLGYFNHGFSTTYLESLGQTENYGIYVVGVTIGTYLTVFSAAINNTFQPDLYESITKRWWTRYIKVCFAQIFLISLIVLTFILLAPYVIALLTANRYVDSTPFAQIMSVAAVTSSIYYIINNFSIATDHPNLYLITTIIGSGVIIGIMPTAVDMYGFKGGAWVTVLSYLIFSSINLILLFLILFKQKFNKS